MSSSCFTTVGWLTSWTITQVTAANVSFPKFNETLSWIAIYLNTVNINVHFQCIHHICQWPRYVMLVCPELGVASFCGPTLTLANLMMAALHQKCHFNVTLLTTLLLSLCTETKTLDSCYVHLLTLVCLIVGRG